MLKSKQANPFTGGEWYCMTGLASARPTAHAPLYFDLLHMMFSMVEGVQRWLKRED